MTTETVYLPDIVGKGYGTFWNYRGRYRVVKGSRASKKSKTTALNFICRLMEYKNSNLLVVRKTFRTLKDSCFAELKWAAERLRVASLWQGTLSPLEMTYIPTGQKIYFRGLDDPLKITSITVSHGVLCWLWIEEAYEISSEGDFDVLQESIRGEVPDGLFKQITLTFNPWNEGHWLKRRFFDVKSDNILAITTNYMCNEWLDAADLRMFEDMKANSPGRYNVAGLGNWGVSEGLVFENVFEEKFSLSAVAQQSGTRSAFGLDFGYINDPTAFFCGIVDEVNKIIYVFDEMYEKALTNEMIYERINKMGYSKEKIVADCAEPKSIDRLYELGLKGILPSKKGRDSIINGIDYIREFKITVDPKCVNFLTEIRNYTWAKDKFGRRLNVPIDGFNHLMDAMRYAVGRKENLFTFE